ncbi:uncharacterized protein LOC143622770 [Bidens hawaiensis]|uniref:uncharacterized protein LOC143622770 n=1 Tax=Bidens hawaiensis TaxID=980011 RepID=UPI00404A89BB
MEQKLQISSFVVCDRLLPLAAKYPWLQEDGYQVGTDPLCYYPCRIPALMGRRVRGYFHNWVILSSHPDNVMWYLWNPVTLKTIYLPPLVLKDGDYESIGGDCCLPYPPEDTGSILLLNRTKQRTFVFCRLDRKRKNLRWTEMTYARQLKSITDRDGFLKSLTCCDGKVDALNNSLLYGSLIQVDIVVNDKEVVITLLPFVETPSDSIMSCNTCFYVGPFLKGGTELFFVIADVRSKAMRTLTDVHLFKLDMSSMTWGRPGDLNNTIFFIDLAHSGWLFYRPTLSSELGGHIHIFGKVDKVISSYNFKDNTVFLSSMPCLVPKNYLPLYVLIYCMCSS